MMEAWEAMQALRDHDKCRSIGVSNFTVRRLEETFLPQTDESPAVNQVEFHPFWYRKDLLDYCNDEDIRLESWGSLTRAEKLDHPTLLEMTHECGKTAAQVLLRWHLQHGVIVIPKSAHADRIRENADIFDFELSDDQMARMDSLSEGFSLSGWLPCPREEWY
jgi:diketogulonate reductase-like aldo/keto reductase